MRQRAPGFLIMRAPARVRDHGGMPTPTDLHVVTVDQRDPRLGRQVVQDPRSRGFPMRAADTTTWRSRSVRLYDPTGNPNQHVGCCTGCDKAMEGNATGNRVPGRVLKYPHALSIYRLATQLDPWPGSWEPTDTGSSGLAASRAAQRLGLGGAYQWALAGGVDAVVQAIVDGRTVGCGTWWYEGMFDRKRHPKRGAEWVIEPTGPKVGGHQFRATAWEEYTDMVRVRCWWGTYRDVWIKRTQLGELLADDGDAHTQSMVP